MIAGCKSLGSIKSYEYYGGIIIRIVKVSLKCFNTADRRMSEIINWESGEVDKVWRRDYVGRAPPSQSIRGFGPATLKHLARLRKFKSLEYESIDIDVHRGHYLRGTGIKHLQDSSQGLSSKHCN